MGSTFVFNEKRCKERTTMYNHLKKVKNVFSDLEQMAKVVSDPSFQYQTSETFRKCTELFDKFCPFEIGDRVELLNDIKLNKGSGWSHLKWFLVKGSPCEIVERDFRDGKFKFTVRFDLGSGALLSQGIGQPKRYFVTTTQSLLYISDNKLVKSSKQKLEFCDVINGDINNIPFWLSEVATLGNWSDLLDEFDVTEFMIP